MLNNKESLSIENLNEFDFKILFEMREDIRKMGKRKVKKDALIEYMDGFNGIIKKYKKIMKKRIDENE